MSEIERNLPPEGTSGDHLDEDVFIGVVAGFASQQDLERVLTHVAACHTCEQRLRAAGSDWETIRAKPAPESWGIPGSSAVPDAPALQRLPRGSTAKDSKRGLATGHVRVLRFAVPLALAAAILIVALGRRPQEPGTSQELSYWIPATSEILKLRGAHPAGGDAAFWTGLDAYEARDLGKAMTLLEESKTSGGLEDLRRLHLASVLVNSGRAEEALTLLKELDIDSLPMPWREDAYWMEYLALAILDRSTEANARLAEMAAWPGRIGDLARQRLASTAH